MMHNPPHATGHVSETSLKRRTLLRTSLTASAGLAGVLWTKTPPAYAQEHELKLLTFSHFVPSSDEELKRQLEAFGHMAGIKVRMDRVARFQLPTVHASEVQGQKGHDITAMAMAGPHLYSNHLVNLDDLVDQWQRRAASLWGGIVGQGADGHYRAMPWLFISVPIAVRTDLVADLGETLPDTWEDVHRIGKKLKAKGHPVGIQMAHSFDANAMLRGIIWSWGGKLVEADGKTVAIHSKETVEAYKFMKALYQDTMAEDGSAWDDRHHTERPSHRAIHHMMPPKGPAGRHMCAAYHVIGIWKFSPVIEAAKAFLDFHFQ